MSKIIETNFPFSEISLLAERESWRKEIYRPIYYIHKWWARRLGSVFRGIILAACLEESEDFWQHYYSRNKLDKIVVYDPFMGSGVTVGEAIKLGCKVIGRDINQVAYLASRAAFSKYSTAEIHSTYRHLEDTVAPHLLKYYRTTTASGDDATVLYFFLVKLVNCPNCGGEIELYKTRIFSRNAVPRKDPSARSSCPGCGEINNTIYNAKETVCQTCNLRYSPQEGNITGAKVTCNHCQENFLLVNRMQSLDGPLNYRRYAKLVLTSDGKKIYETLNNNDKELERLVKEEYTSIIHSFPKIPIKPGYNTNQVLKHNYRYWHQLLSDRQLLCARIMINAIKSIDQDNIQLLFACLLSGVFEFNNLFTSFKGEGTGAVRHMFAHHVLKPEMMPLEANFWGTKKSSGAFSCLYRSRVERALGYKSDPFELKLIGSKSIKVRGINQPVSETISDTFSQFEADPHSVYLSAGDSSSIDLADKSVDLVITDPPFFDNVHYSQLADFFYYWINQIIKVSQNTTTRSPNEVQDTNSDFFATKLTKVFTECRRVLRPEGLLIFTYHHSRHEGWIAIHKAIRNAGFNCIKSYPIKAEMSVSIPLQQAKSPIHLDLILICKKSMKNETGYRRFTDISRALRTAKKQLDTLRCSGIKVSLGDAKVILMGCFLCEVNLVQNINQEVRFLENIEQDIDSYVSQVIATKGEVLYKRVEKEHVQLVLFEDMEKYLVQKHLKQTSEQKKLDYQGKQE